MVKYGFNIRFNHLLIHTAVLRSTSTVVTVMYSNHKSTLISRQTAYSRGHLEWEESLVGKDFKDFRNQKR